MFKELTPATSQSGEGTNMLDTFPARTAAVIVLIIAIFLPRLASLGKIVTVDEGLWQGRGEQFIKAFSSGHFERTLISGQPGVITNWLIGLSHPWRSLPAAEAAIALAAGFLLLLITYALTQLWGFHWGVVGGFLLALNPFLIAHSRVAHTDALFSVLLLASFIFLLLFSEQTTSSSMPKRYVVLSAILFAGALLTRSTGIIVIPAALLILSGTFIRTRAWRKGLETVALWAAVVLLTIFALWPALWVNPAGAVRYLTERTTLHVSEGTHAGETTARWWYYARDGLFRTTPVATLAFLPALFAAAKKRDGEQRTSVILLLTGLLLAIVLSFSADKSDRYILFSLLALDLFAVLGMRMISERLKHRAVQLALPTLCLAYLAIEAVTLHPYYLAHYNRLYPVESYHKLGWGEGLEQAAVWLNEKDPGAKIASYYPSVMKNWYRGPIDPLNHLGESSAKYAVLYRSMFERGEGHVDSEIAAEFLGNPALKPVHIISINHLPYVWIYERE